MVSHIISIFFWGTRHKPWNSIHAMYTTVANKPHGKLAVFSVHDLNHNYYKTKLGIQKILTYLLFSEECVCISDLKCKDNKGSWKILKDFYCLVSNALGVRVKYWAKSNNWLQTYDFKHLHRNQNPILNQWALFKLNHNIYLKSVPSQFPLWFITWHL